MSEQVRSFGMDPVESNEVIMDHINNGEGVYEDLRAALTAKVEVEPVVYGVPTRPGVELRFLPDIEFDLLRGWMKAAARNKKKEFNPLAFAYMVISKTNTGVLFNGKEETDSEGNPLTVTHNEFRQMVGANEVSSAIHRLYGNDGHIIQVAQKVVEAAGYDDMDMEEGSDPLGL